MYSHPAVTMSYNLPDLPEPVRNAIDCSRFLRRQLESRPWLAGRLAATLERPLDAAMLRAFLHDEGLDEANLKPVLRKLRAWAISHILVRDLAGCASLAEVT
ncbi:MAG: bifunctional glutamine synthetase adenylyltransferase/deadenyltransferase, partial [Zoogloea sp.]|nr:bifunctional glutamine synthetase adenylyltransferase/deadenyltransferase [Zoogloea sp.]